ncbi:MAG: hypothetical protein AAFV53_14820 [Myxococcota bacterium]
MNGYPVYMGSMLFMLLWAAAPAVAEEELTLEVVSMDELDDSEDERPFGSGGFLLLYLTIAGLGVFATIRARPQEEG